MTEFEQFPDLSNEKLICIDVETNDPGIRNHLGVGTRRGGYICGLGVGTPDKQWYFPVRHELGGNMDREQVFNWAREQLCKQNQPKLFANALYDLDYLHAEGIPVTGPYNDVQIAEPLIDENRRSYALNSLAHYYTREGKDESDLYQWCANKYGGKPERKQAGNIWRAPVHIVEPYAHSDCYLPFPIFEKQQCVLQQENLTDLYNMEIDLLEPLLAMRQAGIRFDAERAVDVESLMEAEEACAQHKLDILAGFHVEVWAATSVAKIFDKYGLPYPLTPKSKKPSFTQSWLEELAGSTALQKQPQHAQRASTIAALVGAIRRWNKAKGTFVQGLIKYSTNGRIHTEFNQLRSDQYGTVSGRFSSSSPNLQNQPSRDPELLALIRSLFIPEDDHELVAFDYSQIEFRVLTHYGRGASADTARAMYLDNPNTDFHEMVAELTGMERTPAKNCTFALAYGAGVGKLAAMIGCSLNEAKEMFNTYHRRLPFLQELSKSTMRVANNRGYIRTIMNRRRRFNTWENKDWDLKGAPLPYEEAVKIHGQPNIRRAKTYTALNALSQGTAADIAKKALVDIWKSGVCNIAGVPLLLVHDEIVFSIPKTKEGAEARKEIKYIMENTIKLRVPLRVSVAAGNNWGECK